MSASQHVLVIGAASMDVKGRARRSLQPGTSVPGEITVSFGGVARNVAENLARLGQPTILLSAVGSDPFGAQILERTASAGVNVGQVIIHPDYHSGAYLAVLDPAGTQAFAVDEMTPVMQLVTPAYVYARRGLFKVAAMVVLDANLSPSTLRSAIRTAKGYGVPLAADPTSTFLAQRLIEYLPDLYMVTPNVPEAEVLCGTAIGSRTEAMSAAQQLVAKGVQVAIITLAEKGLCYATSRESGFIPAIRCGVVDLTGAGDALTAAIVYGVVNGFSIGEATRLGVSAATLTLQCVDTVCPDLNLERLYDQLVI